MSRDYRLVNNRSQLPATSRIQISDANFSEGKSQTMEFTAVAKPEIFGPGMWFMIHTEAKEAVTDELKRAFAHNMDALCNNFRCLTCKPHFREFIDTHKFANYWNVRDDKHRDVGMFKWSWELHNAVNSRLNKPLVNFDLAYDYYANPQVGTCSNCSSVAIEHTGVDIPAVGFEALQQIQSEAELESDVKHIIDLYRNRSILSHDLR